VAAICFACLESLKVEKHYKSFLDYWQTFMSASPTPVSSVAGMTTTPARVHMSVPGQGDADDST
jgi:hypothetical protein